MTQLCLLRTWLVLPVVLLSLPAATAHTQTRQSVPDDALFRTMASLDTGLFDAFNTCNLEQFASFFVEDVEFYHDKGGVTRGRSALVDSVKHNVCGKTRRDPIPGTLEVHPMDGYGALRSACIAFATRKRRLVTAQAGASASSSTSGRTRMAPGRSPASLATIMRPL